jgi:hypothetical protein
MKLRSHLKTSLSLLLVSTLAATIMPTSVNAETTDFGDNVVTVEVDLGSEGPDPDLCEGFTSLEVPSETMSATFNRRVSGIDDPTVVDVLAYWFEGYDYETSTPAYYGAEELENTLLYLNNYGWTAVTSPEALAAEPFSLVLTFNPEGGGLPTGPGSNSIQGIETSILEAEMDWLTGATVTFADGTTKIVTGLNTDIYGSSGFISLDSPIESQPFDIWPITITKSGDLLSELVSIDYERYAEDGGRIYLQEDLNEDGQIDAEDAPEWLTQTRRSYKVDWFDVNYDANECVDSDDMAMVFVGREPVLRAEDISSMFVPAEIGYGDNVNWNNPNLENLAEAYLKVRAELFGGLISYPNRVAWDWSTDSNDMNLYGEEPVAFGDEGSVQMLPIINIYGSSPTGIYRANFYYQLEVNDEDYFLDNFEFFMRWLLGLDLSYQ